jgi:hypothetical protein
LEGVDTLPIVSKFAVWNTCRKVTETITAGILSKIFTEIEYDLDVF